MVTPSMSGVVWMKKQWKLRHNPFPDSGIARLGGSDPRENGQLFQPEVQQEKIAEAVEKYVLGAAYSGLKFGFLWSLGVGLAGDQRGFGKSVLLQWLVAQINTDWGRQFFLDCGLDEADAAEAPLCALLASFDMANARSLAAVFYEATRHACRERIGDGPTLAGRLHTRLVERLGTDDPALLEAAVLDIWANLRGRNLGPPIRDFVAALCVGDPEALGRYVEEVKAGARGRVSAANYLATFLLFVRAAGIAHVLLGCDQLEDFAATTTTRQKRSVEVERFRDYVLEIQPMADMLTVIVTLHPRAQQAIYDMWKLADLPDFSPDRVENQSRVVVLDAIRDVERARSLLWPYLDAARTAPAPVGEPFAPFTDDAIAVLLDRSDGKPRDILRKAYTLIEQGSARNWERIDGVAATEILDSLAPLDLEPAATLPPATALEELWTQ